MAKIHNPQDQDGIVLINQTVFDGEVSDRTQADTQLQTNIDNEVDARIQADTQLQTNIDSEVNNRTQADTELQTNIDNEVNTRIQADTQLQTNIDNEVGRATSEEEKLLAAIEAEETRAIDKEDKLNTAIEAEETRAIAKETTLNEAISALDLKVDGINQTLTNEDGSIRAEIETVEAAVNDEVEARTVGDALINSAISKEVTRATGVETDLLAQITNEIERASANELSIMSCFNDISGHEIVTPLANRPSDIVEATALAVKGANNLNSIVGRKVKAIEFDVDNTVSTPHYIAIYKDNNGTKNFIAVSEATTWTNGSKAKFVFNTPFTLENSPFEIFLVDNLNVVGKPTNRGDLPAPSNCLKIYSLLNEVNDDGGNYRRFNGNWNNDEGRKRSYYITYHFDAARLDTLESSVKNHKDDDVKHITSEERASWNAKPSMESINAKLEDYQLKSEVEESSDRYKFIPDNNSSSINVDFADIETNGNFSGGVTTSVPGISGNIGEQTARFNNEIGLSLTNLDGEIVCSASIALNMGSPDEFGGMPGSLNEITYGEYSTLEEYGITIHPYFNNETGNFAWTISEYSGYEGLRTDWMVSIGDSENRIQKTISGGQSPSTSYTQATLTIPQNIYKVDIINGTTVETYTVGEAFSGTLCTVNGNTLTAVAQGSSGNNLHAELYAKNNQPIDKTLVLNLNKDNAKVITANAAFNSKQLNPVINDGTVSIEATIESTDSSGYIILNTICDSTTYDNAQYVCHVVPVSITA